MLYVKESTRCVVEVQIKCEAKPSALLAYQERAPSALFYGHFPFDLPMYNPYCTGLCNNGKG